MPITAKSIIDKAVIQLTDISGIRWTRAELLGWLNDGQRAITVIQPTASNTVAVVPLVSGTRQTLPSTGWMLLDVYRYMGTDGATPGRAIRLITRELLDSFDLYWHSATQTAEPKNYLYDLQDQRAFHVYPPNNGTGRIQINYSQTPADLASETDAITILDIYQPALLDYVLYRACMKDAEYAPGVALAGAYLTSFSTLLGGKGAAETGNNPNQSLLPFNPNVPGAAA
jgi:hypothetical protein